jgi:antitoxin (DNA-binding transcriptional repressor) of toxin-antitoxin stability system
MTTMTAREAELNFEELLEQVENGETVDITRDGRGIARVSTLTDAQSERDQVKIKQAVDDWLAYRKEHNITLGGLSIRELIDDGRKY